MSCSVYEFYDAGDRVLYVGMSGSILRRLAEHSTEKRWWRLVARVQVFHFDTREEAAAEEEKRIAALDPAFNILKPGWVKPYVPPKPRPERTSGAYFHPYYTPKQLADLLEIDAADVLAMAKGGTIPGLRLPGGKWRFQIREVAIALLNLPESSVA